MIENDSITLLENDAILDGYLGSTAGDTRIYPIQAPQDAKAPYIVFYNVVGSLDENIDEIRLQLTINGGLDILNLKNMRDRIKILLDKQDELVASSTDYWIYYSKLTASESLISPDTEEFIEVMFFNIKFNKK